MDKQKLAELLIQCLPADAVLINEPMAKHTTFKIGGPADFMVEPSNADEILAVIKAARSCDAPWYVMGCGSNILVSDAGIKGVVIHIGKAMANIELIGNSIVAQAGATNEDVAAIACAAGLAGYEFASGIPGSIGGAAIMNAGAYDGEFKDVCRSMMCLSPAGEVVKVRAEEAQWSYRHSMMMDAGYVVLSATLELHPGNTAQIQAKIDELTQRRASKQPLEMASAGSTFKRPEGYFAGKLVQDAGMRGYTVGGAMMSTKHCGFVVNTGNATASDVLKVIRDVQTAVLQSEGVQLQTEVRMWGFDEEL